MTRMIKNHQKRTMAKWHYWILYFSSLVVFGGAVFSSTWASGEVAVDQQQSNKSLQEEKEEQERLIRDLDQISLHQDQIREFNERKRQIQKTTPSYTSELRMIDDSIGILKRRLEDVNGEFLDLNQESEFYQILKGIRFRIYTAYDDLASTKDSIFSKEGRFEILQRQNANFQRRIQELELKLSIANTKAGPCPPPPVSRLEDYNSCDIALKALKNSVFQSLLIINQEIGNIEGMYTFEKKNGRKEERNKFEKKEFQSMKKSIEAIKKKSAILEQQSNN